MAGSTIPGSRQGLGKDGHFGASLTPSYPLPALRAPSPSSINRSMSSVALGPPSAAPRLCSLTEGHQRGLGRAKHSHMGWVFS